MAESKVIRLSADLVVALEEYRKLKIESYDLHHDGVYDDHWEREKRLYEHKPLIDVLEDCVYSSIIILEKYLDDMKPLREGWGKTFFDEMEVK